MQLALGDPAETHHEFAPPDREPRRVALDEHAADTRRAGALAEARVDQIEPGGSRPGDVSLVSGEQPAFGRLRRARREVGRRRARVGLRDGDRGLLPLEHPREVPTLLRLGAVGAQRADDAEIALDDDASGDAAGPGDLLDHEHHVEQRAVPAPVLARDRHAHEAGGDEILDVVPGVFLAVIPARGALGEDAIGQLARPRPQRDLLGGQIEVHQM